MSITNRTTYPLPTLPTLGAAGYTFTDPTFGSRMARVTDGTWLAALGATAGRPYATSSAGYQQMWNADGTKFFVVGGDGNHYLCSFNRSTMATALLGSTALPFSREPATWHPTNPNLLYGVGIAANHHTLVKVDTTSIPWTTTTFLDLDAITPGLTDTYIGALSVCNGNLMCIYGGAGQEYMRYVLWYPMANPSALKVIDTLTLNGMDEFNSHFTMHSAQLDKSGRYVDWATSGSVPPVAPYHNYFWDTTTNTVTPCRTVSGGHEALGWDARVNADADLGPEAWDAAQWVLTPTLANVNSGRFNLITTVMTPKELFLADHSSWNNATAGTRKPVFSATYRYYDGPLNVDPVNDVPWRAWDNEILGIETAAAGGTVTRYCHHRSLIYPDTGTAPFEFWYTPRLNVDCQGEFALFSSNWGKTLGVDTTPAVTRQRIDVFAVELNPVTTVPAVTFDYRLKLERRHKPYAR